LSSSSSFLPAALSSPATSQTASERRQRLHHIAEPSLSPPPPRNVSAGPAATLSPLVQQPTGRSLPSDMFSRQYIDMCYCRPVSCRPAGRVATMSSLRASALAGPARAELAAHFHRLVSAAPWPTTPRDLAHAAADSTASQHLERRRSSPSLTGRAALHCTRRARRNNNDDSSNSSGNNNRHGDSCRQWQMFKFIGRPAATAGGPLKVAVRGALGHTTIDKRAALPVALVIQSAGLAAALA
jgi:hypothetical protein